MTAKQPFAPKRKSNQVVTVGAAAAFNLDKNCKQVRVVNTGANKGYFVTYGSDETPLVATAADYCIPAGMASIITKGERDKISTFSAAGTTFEIMDGDGF